MTDTDKLVLCGFMGTGKTTVGRVLAERMGGRFVDLDDVLEQRFGMPVRRIFEARGERVFRDAEREACAQVGALGATVVAVGGGAVLDPVNRKALAAFGSLVCLTASVAELERRLSDTRSRPLLQGDVPLARRIRALLDERRDAYEVVSFQVDTTGRTPQRICDAILSSLALRGQLDGLARLAVNTGGGDYDVCVGGGAMPALGRLLTSSVPETGAVALVTNPVVGALHGEVAVSSLRSAGLDVTVCEIPDGETHKTLATVSALYAKFVEMGLDRHGTVVALGGGVTGDTAGFAAATYLRGVRVVQVPTTLLAMVDASIGGKTGVDLPEGKNLVGAFKQPVLVVADPGVLTTLPTAERKNGMAEVIKHGIIDAPRLLERLGHGDVTIDTAFLTSAIRVKVDVVNEDPLELGRRAVLNLGHTFAHGFERVSGYRLPHGIAVGVGLCAAARLGRELGVSDVALEEQIVTVLERCGLPSRLEGLAVTDVRAAMGTDKKRVGNRLRFVVPRAVGGVTIVEAPDDKAVQAALRAVLG